MINVDNRKKQARIVLNKDFYPKKFVSLAIDGFKDVCLFEQKGSELILKLKNKGRDIEKTGYEFCNYVLGLIKNEGLF